MERNTMDLIIGMSFILAFPIIAGLFAFVSEYMNDKKRKRDQEHELKLKALESCKCNVHDVSNTQDRVK